MWRIVDGRLNLAAGPPAQTASRVAKDGLKKTEYKRVGFEDRSKDGQYE